MPTKRPTRRTRLVEPAGEVAAPIAGIVAPPAFTATSPTFGSGVAVEAEPEHPHDGEPTPQPVVQPEPPFGTSPDDLSDGEGVSDTSADHDAPAGTPSVGGSVTIVYRGRQDGGPAAGTETFIVPDDGTPYEGTITSGDTVRLERGIPKEVTEAQAKWLTGHPTFAIERDKQP